MTERTGPWLVESAVAFLDHKFFPFIFEYGSGNSTLWFVNRCVHIYSVEHDKDWYDKVSEMTARHPGVNVLLRDRPYAEAINEFPHIEFGLVIVDGRDRVECIKAAIPRLKSGGLLVLDNSERDEYKDGIALMEGWNRIHFEQHSPDKYGFTYPGWTTTIFFKP
jgi:predicted O-methyltransferase YrrM